MARLQKSLRKQPHPGRAPRPRSKARIYLKPAGPDLRRLTPGDVLHLQRTVGNRATTRLIQARRESDASLMVGPGFEQGLAATRGKGQPLPAGVQRRLEPQLGADLSGVRVHTGPTAGQLAGAIQAQAFTQGADVYMPAAHYRPDSPAGARLLAHEMAHVVQQGAAPALDRPADKQRHKNDRPGTPAIQRKIGFELETGIPITTKYKGGYYKNPGHAWKESILGGSEITVDSAPGHTQNAVGKFGDWPIIEFVSKAVDDSQDPDVFEAQAEDWVDLIGDLRDLVDGTPPPNKLKDVVGSAKPSKKVGFIDAQTKMNDRTINSISVQFTIGAKIDKIAQVFQGMGAIAEGTGGGKSIWERADALKVAVTNVEKLAPALEKKISSPHATSLLDSKTKKALTKQRKAQDMAEMKGFLQLVSNYLVAGKMVSMRGYIKNRTQLFFKSKLSSVAQQLAAQNNYAQKVLMGKAKDRNWLKAKLIEVNERDGSEKVFLDTTKPIINNWLDDVLTGRDDEVFDQARNPWSDEIAPDKVGGQLAAVMEMRTPGTVFGLGEALDIKTKPDQVVAYLKRLYIANQATQNLT